MPFFVFVSVIEFKSVYIEGLFVLICFALFPAGKSGSVYGPGPHPGAAGWRLALPVLRIRGSLHGAGLFPVDYGAAQHLHPSLHRYNTSSAFLFHFLRGLANNLVGSDQHGLRWWGSSNIA